MLSLPYVPAPAAPSPGSVFSNQPFKLARWVAAGQEYAVIDAATSRNDTRASFAPPSSGVVANPVGLGYWVYLPQDTPLILSADPVLTTTYRIPIVEGWNQIGDPYVLPVRLRDMQFQTGTATVSALEALSQGWLRPSVFRLRSGSTSDYDKIPTGDLVLQPWESVWLRSSVPGSLIVRSPL
jgi:hypothetical protein